MATSVGNTIVYKEDWAKTLQDRLAEPNKWKDICRVEITNQRVLHNPYITDPTVQTGSRGSSYTYQVVTETDESVTFSTFYILPQLIDRADLAQSGYAKQMELADRQGVLMNEKIESAVFANHAALTNFGLTDLANTGAGDTSQITVSATNIDDIIRAIRRVINVAKGQSYLERNGGFIVWRPADLEILEGFMQANGFATADTALKNGVPGSVGFQYMGFTHYSSNLLTANHVIAGVKKVYHLGILKDTYGQIMVDDKDPAEISGISVVSRVDMGIKAWANVKPILLDVNVA